MKKLFSCLIALSCLSSLNLTANAQDMSFTHTCYELKTENFTYIAWGGYQSVQLFVNPESGIECDPNFMITGVTKLEMLGITRIAYSIIDFHSTKTDEDGNLAGGINARGVIYADVLEPYLENAYDLDVGDLLYTNCPARYGGWVLPESDYDIELSGALYTDFGINSVDDVVVEVIGYAPDIFGSDFTKVMRREAVWDYQKGNSNITCTSISQRMDDLMSGAVMGDATEDYTVNILDVIAINKSILGKTTMESYAQYVSDINKDGVPDASDSLEVLKYIVGLTESLDAQET